jgi:hypothetical protein
MNKVRGFLLRTLELHCQFGGGDRLLFIPDLSSCWNFVLFTLDVQVDSQLAGSTEERNRPLCGTIRTLILSATSSNEIRTQVLYCEPYLLLCQITTVTK